MRNENPTPARLVSPGAVLRRELEARGWSQKDLAEITCRPEQAISEIVQGQKRITPETALDFGKAFGTSPDLWLGLESNYRLRLGEREKSREQAEKAIEKRARIYRLVPVRELMKRGWIKRAEGTGSLERAVCAFLGISSLDQEPALAVSFRHSQARRPELGAQLAWVKRVEAVARSRKSSFNRAAFERGVPKVLEYARRAEDVGRALEAVALLGVRVAVVPALPQSYVDGVAFYADGQPVIAVSLRYDRIDAFWFSLMHELAHIASGDKAAHIDIGDDDAREERSESAANARAGAWLVDPEKYRRFVARNEGRFSAPVVQAFAGEIARHPGIVVGRLQHDGHVPYKNLRGTLVSVREHLGDWLNR
jgi:HTH-type transcriptional regulator/antitoxin HigA